MCDHSYKELENYPIFNSTGTLAINNKKMKHISYIIMS